MQHLPPTEEDLARMSLLEHLEELRKRLLWSLVTVAVAFIPCWIYVKEIFFFLQRPIQELRPGEKLVFTGLADPFLLYFKVGALAALFLATPFLLYQLWGFIAPGLYKRERLYLAPFLLFGSLFFLAGGAFAYYVAFPMAADFLLSMGEGFEMMLTVERYFSFLLTMILGLGMMFELPVVILVLAALGVVTPRFLLVHFRWAVLIIFVVSAIITPTPDIVNLCVFAVPALLLYLLGVGAAFVVAPKPAAETAEDEL
ncbi:MAG TPA: twin-arginine translocase subunit TatC [Thermoanaerobaculia bacterium]|nr:twin-arginine translocase subunit TatC [Thermoanaerobaculia bacterium]